MAHGGVHATIWQVADRADRNMVRAFAHAKPATLQVLVAARLVQNRRRKRLVRKILLVDFRHPCKAIARTQRTSRLMAELAGVRPTQAFLAATTFAYTLVVIAWLADRSDGDRWSHALSARLMRLPALFASAA